MVAATVVLPDGSFGETIFGMICGYENRRQVMRLVCPSTVTLSCSQHAITIEDYISGKVAITRMVNEEPEEPVTMTFHGRAYNYFNSQTASEGLVAIDETSPHVKAMINDVYVFPDYIVRYWNGLEWVRIPERMQVLKEVK
jgi:hypothetical protein